VLGTSLLGALVDVGRGTVRRVGRSRLSPCRTVRRVQATVRARRARAFADVDWFDDVGPDELAG
jgi:hypothetical protein